MAFEQELAIYDALQAEQDAASEAWNTAFPRDPAWPMGLAPDSVRFSPEYRACKARYERAAAKTRAFVPGFIKRWKKEYRIMLAERRDARRQAALAKKD